MSDISASGIQRLLCVMAQLRDPDSGCPWDLNQTFSSIAPYTIEESYEVADAITRNNMPDLRDELGDLLFQVAFHSRMAEEADHFDFNDVAHAIADKMIRRHPHVFSDVQTDSTDELNQLWENQKAQERSARLPESAVLSALDGIALNLPALTRAIKIQKRAQRVGFDWPDLPPVVEKVEEELTEVQEAITTAEQSKIDEEIGDLLFTVVNLARHLQVEPETALRQATLKFTRRFQQVEGIARQSGVDMNEASAEQLNELWDQVKAQEP